MEPNDEESHVQVCTAVIAFHLFDTIYLRLDFCSENTEHEGQLRLVKLNGKICLFGAVSYYTHCATDLCKEGQGGRS